MIKFLVSRYILYAVIVLEILIVPLLLLKQDYIKYEYLKNITNLSSFILLGSHTGFVFYFYSKKNYYFSSLFKVGILILLLSSIVYSIIYSSFFVLFPVLCYGISIFLEKKMQIEKNFYLAILYKPLLAVTLIFTIFVSVKTSFAEIDVYRILALGYSGALIIWFLLIRFFSRSTLKEISAMSINYTKSDILIYANMVRVGVVENAATILLSLHLFVDRYVMNHFYQDELPSYSLAFNFSQLVFVGINSLAYIHNIEIGETFSEMKQARIKQILRNSFAIFVILFLGVVAISFIYELLFPHFISLLIYTIILSLFVGIFYVCNVVGVVPLYKEKQMTITLLIAFVCIINICLSFIFYKINVPVIWAVFKTGLLLSLAGMGIVYYSIKLINEAKVNE